MDAYIEQLAEDPRLFLDFRMSKLNHAALVDSDSTRSYMQKDVAARYYQAGGTLAISSFQTTVADGTTVSLDGEIILTAEMAGLEIRHTYAIMATLTQEVLLGMDLLRKLGLTL